MVENVLIFVIHSFFRSCLLDRCAGRADCSVEPPLCHLGEQELQLWGHRVVHRAANGEFFDRYLSISVEQLNFDRPANLIEEEIDVAIHSGELSYSSLIAKKIAETSVVLVATPEYLEKHRTPKHPNQLGQHRSVAYMYQGAPRPWIFEKRSTRIVHQPDGNLRTSDAEQMRRCSQPSGHSQWTSMAVRQGNRVWGGPPPIPRV